MEKIIIQVLILFIFWVTINAILKKLLNKSIDNSKTEEIRLSLQQLASGALSYRKTVMFDIIILLYWIAIVYYIVMAFISGILIITSLNNEMYYEGNKPIINELWLLFWAKLLNEISDIIMIFTLWALV